MTTDTEDTEKTAGQTSGPAATSTETRPGAKPDAAKTGADAGKPEELSEEELRLMADTMPGDGPGD
ncbi:MAG TPA: hypothetical protein VGP06_11295 [Janthinobacterium sp.]|nr:hypothetical protein [Janthinobacterium sp.]